MNNSKFKTIRETARAGIMPEQKLRDLVHQKKIPGFYSGNRFYVNIPMLEELIDQWSAESMESDTAAEVTV